MKRAVMEKYEQYIYPKSARQKLKLARETNQTVYLYGMTGFGKTSLITHYLARRKAIFIDAETASLPEFDAIPSHPADEENKTIVVIDQLQFADDEPIREMILSLINRQDLWLILISRALCPKWMLAQRLKQRDFMEITEKDLALSDKEIEEFLMQREIILDKQDFQMLCKVARGHGLWLNIAAGQMKADASLTHGKYRFDDDIFRRSQKILWDYVEYEVYGKWDPWLIENIMRLSIVDFFDKELAEYITGSACVELLFEKCAEIGNFLTIQEGVYYIDAEVRHSMVRRLEKYYVREQRDELYYLAGRYYRQKGNVKRALAMFEKCGNTNEIVEILVEIGKTQPGTGVLYELRSYYLSMSEENTKKYAELMCGNCMLCSLILDTAKSEYWYEQLEQAQKNARGSEKKKIKSMLSYLNVSLPHRGSYNMISLLKDAWHLAMDREISLTVLCVTGNAPSNMNGGKDFCEWSRRDKELAASIGNMICFVLGKHGAGLVDLALAESFFEKGEDDYEVIRRISKGLMQAENGMIEQCFVGQGLLAKLYLRKGNMDDARMVLLSFRKKCEMEKAVWLLPNIENYLCMLDLYSGNSAAYREWMEQCAPDENQDFFTMDRYRYMTKIRIYFTQGKLQNALSLIERMLYYANLYDRPYIRMECELLLAVLEFRMGNENWRETLQKVYERAEDYHFVRLLSAEAGAVLELYEKAKLTIKDYGFYQQVMEETRQMAGFYPGYLKEQTGAEIFTENALLVLRYQAQGLSNEKIAEKMQISVSTVKYHCRENYHKLGVKSRIAAVTEAQKRKLI